LNNSNIIEDESVVVMGHHPMDYGSMIPKYMRNQKTISKEVFLNLIIKKSYGNWIFSEDLKNENIKQLFKNRVLNSQSTNLYHKSDYENVEDVVTGLESWYWQERFPKYLVSTYEFDFYGLDRCLPLWDKKFLEFLSKTNYNQRIGKHLFKEYVDELDGKIRGSKPLPSNQSKDLVTPSNQIENIVKKTVKSLPDPLYNTVKYIHNKFKKKELKQYNDDPRFGIILQDEFDDMDLKKRDYHSLLYLVLYRDGEFEMPKKTELDRALNLD